MHRVSVLWLGVVVALGLGCEEESPAPSRMDSGLDASDNDSGNEDSGARDGGDSGSVDSGDLGSCLHEGVRHNNDTEWFDGCNWCDCRDGAWSCTARYCWDGSVDEACVLPVDPGDCRDSGEERFYYDAMSNRCRPFTAHCGGEGGNDNNFASQSDCWQHCGFEP